MADSFVQLPDDASNTGKKVRTNTRVVGSDTVHEHAFNLIEPGTGPDKLGKIVDDPASQTGSVAASGDTGVLVLAVQNDGSLDPSSDVGDYSALSVDSRGALYVTPGPLGFNVNVPNAIAVISTFTSNHNIFSNAGDQGSIVFLPSGGLFRTFALQVTPLGGTATSWDVRLEVSIDQQVWTTVIQHTQTDGAGTTKFAEFLNDSFRVRCNALSLGTATSLDVYALGSST